jgi:hypothetical protein
MLKKFLAKRAVRKLARDVTKEVAKTKKQLTPVVRKAVKSASREINKKLSGMSMPIKVVVK